MAPFDRLHTSSYSSSVQSVVTMAASFIEIKRDIGRKTPICNILLVFNLHDPLHPFEFLVKILKQTV